MWFFALSPSLWGTETDVMRGQFYIKYGEMDWAVQTKQELQPPEIPDLNTSGLGTQRRVCLKLRGGSVGEQG